MIFERMLWLQPSDICSRLLKKTEKQQAKWVNANMLTPTDYVWLQRYQDYRDDAVDLEASYVTITEKKICILSQDEQTKTARLDFYAICGLDKWRKVFADQKQLEELYRIVSESELTDGEDTYVWFTQTVNNIGQSILV